MARRKNPYKVTRMQFHDFYDFKAHVEETICKPKDINWRSIRSTCYTKKTDASASGSADGSSSQYSCRVEYRNKLDDDYQLLICHQPHRHHRVLQRCVQSHSALDDRSQRHKQRKKSYNTNMHNHCQSAEPRNVILWNCARKTLSTKITTSGTKIYQSLLILSTKFLCRI